jgi:hypothetical protein
MIYLQTAAVMNSKNCNPVLIRQTDRTPLYRLTTIPSQSTISPSPNTPLLTHQPPGLLPRVKGGPNLTKSHLRNQWNGLKNRGPRPSPPQLHIAGYLAEYPSHGVVIWRREGRTKWRMGKHSWLNLP